MMLKNNHKWVFFLVVMIIEGGSFWIKQSQNEERHNFNLKPKQVRCISGLKRDYARLIYGFDVKLIRL